MRKVSGNDVCFDCGNAGVAGPDCASWQNGVFICMKCQPKHKSELNEDVSEVKMAEMDSWKMLQIQCMWNGGNEKMRGFMERYGFHEDASL